MTEPIAVDELMAAVHRRLTARAGVAPAVAPPLACESEQFWLARLQTHVDETHGTFGRELILTRTGWKGRVEHVVKRVIRKLLAWYVQPQLEYNAAVARALRQAVTLFEAQRAEAARLAGELQALQGEQSLAGVPSLSADALAALAPDRDALRAAWEPLLTRFDGCGAVLVPDCGEGAFLELVDGRGAEPIDAWAAAAAGRGLAVECAVAEGWLATSTGDGLFVGRPERRAPAALGRLLELGVGRLAPGSPVVVCVTAAEHLSWADPLVRRPLDPRLVRALAEQAGAAFECYQRLEPDGGETASLADLGTHRQVAVVLRVR